MAQARGEGFTTGQYRNRLEAELPFYAALCGRTLARAHARSGDAVALSGYMGDDSEFDKAIAEFAMAYADQTKRDWRGLRADYRRRTARIANLTRSEPRAQSPCWPAA
jgi:hypothetical protein